MFFTANDLIPGDRKEISSRFCTTAVNLLIVYTVVKHQGMLANKVIGERIPDFFFYAISCLEINRYRLSVFELLYQLGETKGFSTSVLRKKNITRKVYYHPIPIYITFIGHMPV